MNFLRLPVLAKSLGASLFGAWSIIWVTVVLSTSLSTLGLNLAIVRFLAAEKDIDEIRHGFLSTVFTVIGSGTICCLLLFICSDIFAGFLLGDNDSSHFVQLSSTLIVTQSLFQIGIAFFRTFRQISWYVTWLVVKAVIELIFIIGLLSIGWALEGVIIAILASDIVVLIVAYYFILQKIGFEFPRFTHLKDYLRYSLPLVPSSGILWVSNFSDRYIMGYFMGARDVGIYSASYTIANVIALFLGPLQVVLLPTISKTYQEGEITQTRKYLEYSWKYLMAIAIPSVFGISILSVPLLSILTTSEFIHGDMVIPLLATGILFYSLSQICTYIFYIVNKTAWVFSILIAACASNLVFNFILIPRIGILGAGTANLLAKVLMAILSVAISFRYLNFNLNINFIIKCLLASSLMALIIFLLNPMSISQLIISVLLGLITYSVLMLCMKGFNNNELQLLKNLASGFNLFQKKV